MAPHTFLWHDYETFGANTRRDRPAQFAAIRTDMELNEVGEPLISDDEIRTIQRIWSEDAIGMATRFLDQFAD